jgi:Desulfoferrodoxin, N-terminal domain
MDDEAKVNQMGKRYRCDVCGTEVMCVKGGSGRFHCHAAAMDLLTAKPLPSSD